MRAAESSERAGRWRRVAACWSRRIVVAALACAIGLAVWVGWGRTPAGWEESTGWEAVPADQRPADSDPASLDWGESGAPWIGWLGHSGFVVRWNETTLLLDPNTSRRCTVAPRLLEAPADISGLGPIDGVLISHAHYDHLDMPTLERAQRIGTIVLPAGSEEYFARRRWDRTRFVPLAEHERVRIGGLEIVGIPAAHNGNRFHPLRSRNGALGYVVRHGDEAFYYSGDTGFGIDFASIGAEHHPRMALLPIGAYAPRIPMKWYHLTPEETVEAGRLLGVEAVMPCHFGTFVLSLDRPSWALPRFARAAREHGMRWLMPRLWDGDGVDRSVAVAGKR